MDPGARLKCKPSNKPDPDSIEIPGFATLPRTFFISEAANVFWDSWNMSFKERSSSMRLSVHQLLTQSHTQLLTNALSSLTQPQTDTRV